MKDYNGKSGHQVRTMAGRYGEYVLVSDLQKILLRDAVRLLRDGEEVASTYAERLAENLGTMR